MQRRYCLPVVRSPQSTVQEWLRIVCVTLATTAAPMPSLMPEMKSELKRRTEAGQWKEAAVLADFIAALEQLVTSTKKENQDNRRASRLFDKFCPSVLEVSCSL